MLVNKNVSYSENICFSMSSVICQVFKIGFGAKANSFIRNSHYDQFTYILIKAKYIRAVYLKRLKYLKLCL